MTFVAWYIRDSKKVDDFDEKYVLVTGCDSGFGNLVAKQLDRQGFHVIAACLTESGSSELKTASSQRLKTVLLNVTDSAGIQNAVEMVQRETGERGKSDSKQSRWSASTGGDKVYMRVPDDPKTDP